MVKVVYGRNFEKQVRKIKDEKLKEKVKKQIRKILEDPKGCGKPMRYARKGTRESTNKTFQAVICICRKRGQNNISGLLSQG